MEPALLKKVKNGVTKYHKYVLEAKLVFGDIVISVENEWIENSQILNENAIKIHYYLIQIANIIRQLLNKGSKVLKEMKLKTKIEVSKFIINCLALNKITSDLNELDLNFQLRFIDD